MNTNLTFCRWREHHFDRAGENLPLGADDV
jgi:hypothetical protein